MIHWRFAGWSDAGLPSRAEGISWLSAAERDLYEVRRGAGDAEDWLLGRLNAKALIADALDYRYGVRVPAASVEWDGGGDRAGTVRLEESAPQPAGPGLPLRLSGSASRGHALTAAVWVDGFELPVPIRSLGVDLAWVGAPGSRPVGPLAEAERAYCEAGSGRQRDLRLSVLHATEAAVANALGRATRADRRLAWSLPARDAERHWLPPLLTPVDGEWEPLVVTLEPAVAPDGVTVTAMWREIGGFVASIAVAHDIASSLS